MSDSISVTIEFEKVEITILQPDFIQVNLLEPVVLSAVNLNTTHRTSDGKDHSDVVLNNDHRVRTDNPHGVTASQSGAAPSAEGVTNGNTHDHNGGDGGPIDHVNLANKGSNTHAQIDTAITNSTNHIADTTNPHSVTAAQAGADPAGSAGAVQTNLNTHEADTANPHSVTATQIGAAPAKTRDDHGTVSSGTEDFSATFTQHTLTTGGDHAWTFSGLSAASPNMSVLVTATGTVTIGNPSGSNIAVDSPSDLTTMAAGLYLVKITSYDDGVTSEILVFQVTVAAPTVPTSIVAAGDSTTEYSTTAEGTWVDDAAAYTPQVSWTNSGLSGDTASGLWARWATDVTAHSPDAVTIMIGVNDFRVGTTAVTVEGSVSQMLADAASNGIHVYLCKTMPWKGYSSWTTARQIETDAYNAWIDTQASSNVTVIDTYSEMEDDTLPDEMISQLVRADSLHPNSIGYHRIARVMLNTILPGFDSYTQDDLTTFTELDPNNKITVTSTSAAGAAGYQAGTSACYVAVDNGSAIGNNFTAEFLMAPQVANQAFGVSLANALSDFVSNRSANVHQICANAHSGNWYLYETYLGGTRSLTITDADMTSNTRLVELQYSVDSTRAVAMLTVYNGTDKDSKTGILGHQTMVLSADPVADKLMLLQHIGVDASSAVNTVSELKTTL